MKVIIPVAGKGTRLRPLTLTTPKPLLKVAGKPILDHIVEAILPLHPDEIIFVTGYLKEQIEEHAEKTYGSLTTVTFVEQKEQRGTAHAVWQGRAAFDSDVLIDFGDTIFDADLSAINECTCDGIIWVQEVDDPSRFGVIVTDGNGHMTRMVEKPTTFVSSLANIGLYYIKNTRLLEEGIRHALDNHKGETEIYLTEAFQYMVEQGARIRVVPARAWWDCGTVEELEATDRALQAKQS